MQTKTQSHTPGQWTATPTGSIIEDGYFEIALVHGEKRDEKARLIAAAPDLLAALEYVQHVIGQHDEWWIGEFSNEVRAAIAKATGAGEADGQKEAA